MAEIIDLNINIGANTTDFEGSLQKAQNLLKQFEAALKKATNVGEINYLNNSIKNLNGTIAGINQQMNKVGRPAADATNALTNVSRVAQDASYGFIGIANNLNPLLESFQRLSKESGGSTNALKSMAAGLTGPAGIGLALGVASSLVISFGDELSDFANKKLSGVTQAMKLEAAVFKEAQEGYIKATNEINTLNQAHDDYTNGIISKEQFLKQFNATLGDTIKKTDDLATAEKFLRDGADDYIQMMYYKAISTEALNQAAKRQVESLQKQTAPLEPTILQRTISFLAPAGSDNAEERAAKARKEEIDNLDNDAYILKDIAATYKTLGDNMQFNLRRIFGAPSDNPLTTEESDFKIMAKLELADTERYVAKLKEKLKEAQYVLKNERIKLFTLPSERRSEQQKRSGYFDKQINELTEQSNKTGLGAFLMKDAKSRIASYDAEEKKIKELSQAYEDFANMLASNLTSGIMDVFAAFEEGTNPLEAIADMFLNIAKSIAAAIIQATIFQAILTAFPELKALFAASGALQSAFGGRRLAEGGITNGASIAMIGEAGPEAVLPLSKLNTFMKTTFNAGAMSGGSYNTGGSNVAVLRGQDLLVAINRTQKSSFLKGQNISLI
jgi:hypothetical protein